MLFSRCALLLAALWIALPAHAQPVSDFTGDGKSDIFWRNSVTGENYLSPMNGTAILGTEGYVRTVADQNWQIVGVGDFDGDGKADVLWRNSTNGQNYIYFMDGTAIKPTEGYIRTVPDQNWKVAGVGDFDGDGKSDILWRNATTGENYISPMDGLAIKPGEGYLRTVANQDWQVAGVADFNGNGNSDILWRNSSTGETYLYFMAGRAIQAEGYLRTVADQAWKIVGTADFDGDLSGDILWRNSSTGENYLYLLHGTTIAGEGYLRTVADLAWQSVATGDYDGDGRSDILWRNSATGENYLMNALPILPTEGYIRTVTDQRWKVAGSAYAGPVLSCQQQLQQLNVTFVVGPATLGIVDPVTVSPTVNGIVFRTSGGQVENMLMDCTLALALHRVAGDLVARGIDTIDYISIYNYRVIEGTNILSQHAYGTAIDFAAFSGGGTTYSVLDDWVLNGADTCTQATFGPKDEFLHRLACWWHDAGIFKIVLTPNYNVDHRNHFHVDLTPGGDFIR